MKLLFLLSAPLSRAAYGTEIVAQGLAGRCIAAGAEAHLAAHAATVSDVGQVELEEGVLGHQLPPRPPASHEQNFALRTQQAPGLEDLLARLRPDIVQIHGFAANGINLRHVELAKAAGSKVVLWHNVPGITCLQRGLLYLGDGPCDGRLDVQRCTYCRLRVADVPRLVARAASHVSAARLRALLPRRIRHVAIARDLTALHQQACAHAFQQFDAIRVGANWARRVLADNGAPAEKLHLIRPGVNLERASAPSFDPEAFWKQPRSSGSVRLIYWGRVHRSKGVHTVIEALLSLPELPVEFAVFGDQDNDFAQQLRRECAADKRILLYPAIAPEHMLSVLKSADIAMIPSRWHETGPLTVFEAQAAGLPVIGSNRGGVAELCDGPWARLFPAENAAALASLLSDLVGNPGAIEAMRNLVPAPRTMNDVAEEVRTMYASLLPNLALLRQLTTHSMPAAPNGAESGPV